MRFRILRREKGAPRRPAPPPSGGGEAPTVRKSCTFFTPSARSGTSGGAIRKPRRQPVIENVLESELQVITRLRPPGSDAAATCSYGGNTMCSYTSSMMA